MSQQKVDRYKEEKAKRKETLKKEKRIRVIRKCGYTLAALVLVGWIGYSVYGNYQAKQPRENAEVDYTTFSDYLNELNSVE